MGSLLTANPPTTYSAAKNERTDWIDIARGIGIILVVFQHVYQGVVHSGILTPTTFWKIEDYTVYTFHMPLFFFLAGLHVESSLAKGKGRFLKAKLWTVFYPYLLWSLLQGGTQLALAKYINKAISVTALCNILWDPIDQFWFLYSLMLCHLVAMALPKLKQSLLVICIAAFIINALFPFTFLIRQTLYMCLFYAIGVATAGWVKSLPPLSSRTNFAGMIIALMLFSVAVYGAYHGFYYYSPAALPASLLGILITIWISRELASRYSGWLIILGRGSMAIYIMHVMLAVAARLGLKIFHVNQPTVQLIVQTLAGLLLPLLAQELLKRMHLLVPLGLSPLQFAKRNARERMGVGV
jgi:fucose 4-O-acetylase-like acetyltransferase